MKQYLHLLKRILTEGAPTEQRAIKPNGQPLRTLSIFGCQAEYNLQEGFPLVTTKFVSLRTVVEELFWFLSGSTNVKDLQARRVSIWDEWAGSDGELGPIYGKQWRDFDGVDQIATLIDNLEQVITDPRASCGRRLILTSWNPTVDMNSMKAPFACHTLVQFNVTRGRLNCQMYQRSADMFLGAPYNIACYAALMHMIAQHVGLEVGRFIHTIGDAHIYENHLDQVATMLLRSPLPLPTLEIVNAKHLTFSKACFEHTGVYGFDRLHWKYERNFKLTNYVSYGPLKGDVAI